MNFSYGKKCDLTKNIKNFIPLDISAEMRNNEKINNQKEIFQFGSWSAHEREKSSTWRELEAIWRIIKSNEILFSGKILKWQTDCKNLLYICKNEFQLRN